MEPDCWTPPSCCSTTPAGCQSTALGSTDPRSRSFRNPVWFWAKRAPFRPNDLTSRAAAGPEQVTWPRCWPGESNGGAEREDRSPSSFETFYRAVNIFIEGRKVAFKLALDRCVAQTVTNSGAGQVSPLPASAVVLGNQAKKTPNVFTDTVSHKCNFNNDLGLG